MILAINFSKADHLFQHHFSKRQCTFQKKRKKKKKKKEKNTAQNNNGTPQVRRSSDRCRTEIFDLDHAAQADLVLSNS